MMNADLKLPVKCLERDVFGKLIDWSKNGVGLVREIKILKNIRGKGFSDRLHFVARTFYFRQEAEYEDGLHANENLSYIVLEAGTWELESGSILEVGTTDTDKVSTSGWDSIKFAGDFQQAPVVLSQVQTDNDSEFVRTRQRNKSIDGFQLTMEEEEALKNSGHGEESIGWLAIEPGSGSIDGFDYQAQTSANIDHNFKMLDFTSVFEQTPNILASLSSINGLDPSGLRYRNLGVSGVEVKVEEDRSLDNEVLHVNESVDWLAIGGEGLLSATPVDSFI